MKNLAQQTLFPLLLCRNEFAYASSDKLVYIRQFSDRGAEMTLSAVLQGHEAEVTQVRPLQSKLVPRPVFITLVDKYY